MRLAAEVWPPTEQTLNRASLSGDGCNLMPPVDGSQRRSHQYARRALGVAPSA